MDIWKEVEKNEVLKENVSVEMRYVRMEEVKNEIVYE